MISFLLIILLGKKEDWADRQYDKHLDEISAITSQFGKEDYLSLLDSGKCNSFKEFVEDWVGE